MEDSGNLQGLERAAERAVGRVCGLGHCIWKTGKRWASRGQRATRRGVHEACSGTDGSRSGGGGSESSLAHLTGQGGQGSSGISQVGEGFASQPTIDRQTLEVPALEGGIAAFGGIASLVIETFPG